MFCSKFSLFAPTKSLLTTTPIRLLILYIFKVIIVDVKLIREASIPLGHTSETIVFEGIYVNNLSTDSIT